MGRSYLMHYVVEIRQSGVYNTPGEWHSRKHHGIPGDGKPTAANLAKFIGRFEESLKPGGVNAHLGHRPVNYACIRDQFSGNEIVAEYRPR